MSETEKCANCGDDAVIADGIVGAMLCPSPRCLDAAWDRAFATTPTPNGDPA